VDDWVRQYYFVGVSGVFVGGAIGGVDLRHFMLLYCSLLVRY
jgi:hypothetical protein